jgi:hypothetical protein
MFKIKFLKSNIKNHLIVKKDLSRIIVYKIVKLHTENKIVD